MVSVGFQLDSISLVVEKLKTTAGSHIRDWSTIQSPHPHTAGAGGYTFRPANAQSPSHNITIPTV